MLGDVMIMDKKFGLESISEDELHLLSQRQLGFERECLRVSAEAKIALSPHPEALGSALTHSFFNERFFRIAFGNRYASLP